jgi:serine O-acetyltransferase
MSTPDCAAPTEEPPPLPRGDTNGNPRGIGLWALLREDLATHDNRLLEQGFWAVAVHRLGNARMGIRWRLFRAPCTLLYWCLFQMVEWMCGITLPYTTRLGRRVRIWHHGGMILHARSIGHDVHIRQNTTFGVAHRGQDRAIPLIEDRADLGCGVCVLGHVRIGHDSIVGANAVVLRDVPPYSVAVGVPARVVKMRASKVAVEVTAAAIVP